MVYLTLFIYALLAATVIPAYSEIMLGGLLIQGHSAGWLWFWATLGNTLGALVNGIIGRMAERLKGRRWFPVSENQLANAQQRFNTYGQWSLLFSWLPIVGDALPLIGGIMRVPWPNFFILTAIGKGLRYAIVMWLVLGTGHALG